MNKTLLALVVLLMAGCTNTTDPILTESKCMKYETTIVPMPMVISCGTNCTTTRIMLMPVDECVREVIISYPNPNYNGGA